VQKESGFEQGSEQAFGQSSKPGSAENAREEQAQRSGFTAVLVVFLYSGMPLRGENQRFLLSVWAFGSSFLNEMPDQGFFRILRRFPWRDGSILRMFPRSQAVLVTLEPLP